MGDCGMGRGRVGVGDGGMGRDWSRAGQDWSRAGRGWNGRWWSEVGNGIFLSVRIFFPMKFDGTIIFFHNDLQYLSGHEPEAKLVCPV